MLVEYLLYPDAATLWPAWDRRQRNATGNILLFYGSMIQNVTNYSCLRDRCLQMIND
jgi:hypothetical protein